MTTDGVTEIERWLREVSVDMTTPRDGECLLCFMVRQLDELGCDTTLRFAQRYRDLRVPRATALERRLEQVGGFCDCEVFMNGYTLDRRWWTPEKEIDTGDGWVEVIDAQPPDPMPSCQGVGPRTIQPCALWVRQRRW